MDKDKFDEYKDAHRTEYRIKHALVGISHAIYLGSLYIVVMRLIRYGQEQNNLSYLTAALVSFIIVIIPLLLVRIKTFSSFHEALGRSYLSWQKISWSLVQALFIGILGMSGFTTPPQQEMLMIPPQISQNSATGFLIFVLIAPSIFKNKFNFLSTENLLPVLLLKTRSNVALGKKMVFLVLLYVFLIFLFGMAYFMCGESVTTSDKDTILNFWDHIYFSCITLTSTGYGDLSPIGKGMLLSSIESVLGNLYIPLSLGVLFTGNTPSDNLETF